MINKKKSIRIARTTSGFHKVTRAYLILSKLGWNINVSIYTFFNDLVLLKQMQANKQTDQQPS